MTPLMCFYAVFAAAGAVVPWWFNIRYSIAKGALLTPQELIAGGFVTPLAASLTSDFLIGTTPVLVWMVLEARRLGMARPGPTSCSPSWSRLHSPVRCSC